jgi:nickel-dependent lactate racemase
MQQIFLPWGAWSDGKKNVLEIPDGWNCHMYSIPSFPPLTDSECEQALKSPIGTNSLSHIVKGKKNVVIGIEDVTRPAYLGNILEILTQLMEETGIERKNISIINAIGAHKPNTSNELEKKVGKKILSQYSVYNHSPFENLIKTGIRIGPVELEVNRFFWESDARIVLGSVMPHPFAGYSGGAKLIIPGLASIDILQWTHKYVMMGLRGGIGIIEGNKFREEIEVAVEKMGVYFSINLIVNSEQNVQNIYAGDIVKSHRVAVEKAKNIYSTEVPRDIAHDILLLNSFPKDTDLFQADAALNVLRSGGIDRVRENGTIVITTASMNGLGIHNLFEFGKCLYKKPMQKRLLKNRLLVVYSPNVYEPEFRQIYWEGYTLFNRWTDLCAYLGNKHGNTPTVGIFPTASLQIMKQ